MPPKPSRRFVATPPEYIARQSPENLAIEAAEKAVWDAWIAAGGKPEEFADG
jgi:hypothetical protein